MPLSPPPLPRHRMHTRGIRYECFKREDGAYEIEARLTDTKDADCTLASGVRRGGDPVHDLNVRVTFTPDFVITDIETCSDWVPYPEGCETIGPAYKRLLGVSLMQGFRSALRDRLGGIEGCTHVTEMLGGLPTVAIQMRAGEVRDTAGTNGNKPFQLDRCHALATTSETVRRYYPRWYRDGLEQPDGSGAARKTAD